MVKTIYIVKHQTFENTNSWHSTLDAAKEALIRKANKYSKEFKHGRADADTWEIVCIREGENFEADISGPVDEDSS